LTSNAAAFDDAGSVVLAGRIGAHERFDGVRALVWDGNVVFDFLAADGDLSITGPQFDSGDAGFASAVENSMMDDAFAIITAIARVWAACG
jgi:hypothetical protein